MSDAVSRTTYESAVIGRAHFRAAYAQERERVRKLREALAEIRSKGICAGAAFVRGNADRDERVIEVLDIIDNALAL